MAQRGMKFGIFLAPFHRLGENASPPGGEGLNPSPPPSEAITNN